MMRTPLSRGGDAADLWTARLSASAPVATGAQTDLAIDLRSIHLFDAVTEEAIPVGRAARRQSPPSPDDPA